MIPTSRLFIKNVKNKRQLMFSFHILFDHCIDDVCNTKVYCKKINQCKNYIEENVNNNEKNKSNQNDNINYSDQNSLLSDKEKDKLKDILDDFIDDLIKNKSNRSNDEIVHSSSNSSYDSSSYDSSSYDSSSYDSSCSNDD
jgi:hypothetical protein